MAELIKGALIASHIRQQVRKDAAALEETGIKPCLAVCIVGDDPASRLYVRRKQQACATTGIQSVRCDLPATATTDEIVAVIDRWNADPAVHGILVQLRLPAQVDRGRVLDAISEDKDVDGVTSANLGRLAHAAPRFVPCTVAAILELLRQHRIVARGKRVVIINRGVIIGLPLCLILAGDHDQGNATVTLVNEYTPNIDQICRTADIVISAVGKRPAFRLRGSMVKKGAVVIDAGVNRIGRQILGDAEFDEVAARASVITPATGGVGPCTIAMLLKNTITAARLQTSKRARLPITMVRPLAEAAAAEAG